MTKAGMHTKIHSKIQIKSSYLYTMKTKQLYKSWVSTSRTTNASVIIELSYLLEQPLEEKKKFILTYRNGNAYEDFTIEQYDGTKLNTIGSMSDLGVKAKTSAYHLMSDIDQDVRFDMLVKKGIEFIKLLN